MTFDMARGVSRIAALIVGMLAGAAIAGPPQVEIRAQTRLVLDKVRLTGDEVAEVRGELLDNLTGDGIAGQLVAIKIGDQTTRATTGPDGRFRATIAVSAGQQPVELSYRGVGLLGPSQLTQVTDPARAQVALSLEIQDSPSGVTVVVRATADDQPVEIPVALAVGPPMDDHLTDLGPVQSGAPFELTRKAAGGAGIRRVRATFAGDDTRQAATAEKTIELAAGSTTTMKLSATRIAYEDDLGVTGIVADQDGRPVARAAVTLVSGDRRLAQGATAEDGTYRFKIEGEILGQGQWGIQVQSDPGKSSVKPSRSPPEIVRVSDPQPVPVSYTIIAFVATAAAAGGFFAARAKPWLRLRRPAPPADVPTNAAAEEQVEGGLVVAKPGLVSTLRRPSDDGFSGVVRDTVRGRPVAGALVRLRLHQTDRETQSGPDGSFSLDGLAMGEWFAEVVAPGHVTEKFVISIPHRGELRGVRVDLVPVRERVFQLYRRAAEPVLPEVRLWGVWSPRQVFDHVRSKRPSPALSELTDFVEEVYFSPRLAEETVLSAASEQVDRAIRERARAAS
ncbi:MAG TPA: carboxypeptidase-like regulatory domain-containing protein [Kofleriaceae bacterium]|nr:carboxypeptidase-like regulatory domain-containing protein [Kofleriaceae bacterium]